MNILIFNWRDPKNPKSGGAEIVTFEHAKAWVKAGHRVDWFASSFPGSSESESMEGVSVIRRGSEMTVHFKALIFYLFFKKIQYDIIIDEIHGLPFFTPWYVRVPKIIFIHEIAGIIWDYMYPFPLNIIGKQLEKLYLYFYKSQNFWVDAPSTADELISFGINKQNISIIPCPVGNDILLRPAKKNIIPTFIFVSRLVKMKGIEDVLRAFSIISDALPKATLWIVGNGEEHYVKKLKALANELSIYKQTKFFGHVSDKNKLDLMSKAHLLLHASVKEGWGLVVLEAASCGTPCVVYNVSGLRDIVSQYKVGVIVRKNTPEYLASESINLYNNRKKYRAFQTAGLQNIRRLTWRDATIQSLLLLGKVIKKI